LALFETQRRTATTPQMNINQLTAKLSSRPKGSFFSITTRRPVKLKKGFNALIEKQSEIQGLFGVEYANTANVKVGVQSGEREAPTLPKGIKQCFYKDGIKFYESFNGNISMAVNRSGNKPQSIFFMDGKQVSEEQIQNMVLSSELAEKKSKPELADKNQSPFIMVKLENVIDVR
jgi:hypothetical protein